METLETFGKFCAQLNHAALEGQVTEQHTIKAKRFVSAYNAIFCYAEVEELCLEQKNTIGHLETAIADLEDEIKRLMLDHS